MLLVLVITWVQWRWVCTICRIPNVEQCLRTNASAVWVLVLGWQVNDTADEVARLKRTAWSKKNHTSYSFLDLRVSYLMQASHSQGAREPSSSDQSHGEERADNCLSFQRNEKAKQDKPFPGGSLSSLHLSGCLGLIEQPRSVGASGQSWPWSSPERKRGCWRPVELGEVSEARNMCGRGQELEGNGHKTGFLCLQLFPIGEPKRSFTRDTWRQRTRSSFPVTSACTKKGP